MFASKNATAGISNPRDRISWWAMNWRKKSRFILKNIVCWPHLQRSCPMQNTRLRRAGWMVKGRLLLLTIADNVRPPYEVHHASVRFTTHQAQRSHVLAPFYTWRYMTCLRLPAGVSQRCDWKLGPSAPVYTFSTWIDPLRRTWETKSRNETIGNKTT